MTQLSVWDQALLNMWRQDPQKVLEAIKRGEVPLRVISLNQPFCTLMEFGKIETRNRPTNVRGMVMFASCKLPYSLHQVTSISGAEQYGRIIDDLYNNIPHENRKRFDLNGKALSIGFLHNSRKMKLEDEDKCFVEYHHGLYCWEFDTVRSIEPFDYKGKQGWTLLDVQQPEQMEIVNKIKLLI